MRSRLRSCEAAVGRREQGSTIPLMVGFCMVLLILMVMVIGASKAFLVQRQLAAAADAATLAGADGYDTSDIYNGTGASDVGLDAGIACGLARASFGENASGLPAGATYISDCKVNGRRITVTAVSRADLPLVDRVVRASLRVTAESSAEGRS